MGEANRLNKRLAIIADFKEESWPSMDLRAEQLVENLASRYEPTIIRPSMRLRVSRLLRKPENAPHIIDRLINRQWDYLNVAKLVANSFDAFHVVDHSYAAVVHRLPGSRTGVYCHDLDAFRSILSPPREARPWWYRQMAWRILRGMQKAAIVFHNSLQTRQAILNHRLIEESRLVYAPLGIASEFIPIKPENSAIDQAIIAKTTGRKVLLHVGSNIARKRIDLLLQVVARVVAHDSTVMLVKVGDPWTDSQQTLISQLQIEQTIFHFGKATRKELADWYRRADAVLIPSDAEGFGLPVIEAMACGSPVIVSDIPVLRETGGDGAMYAPVGDVEAWAECVTRVLENNCSVPTKEKRLAQASKFSWSEHARIIAEAYQRLNEG